jgi:nicotinamide-nucleotide amidase
VDDMTRDAVALATGRTLALDEGLLDEIACFFAKRSYPMTDNNRKQATLPAGARVIHNPVGTAPSFAVEQDGHVIISLPGVPFEMKYLMEHEVLPYLRERLGLRAVIKSRTVRTCGIGESMIDAQIGDLMKIANPTVGTAAHPGQTDVRITVKAATEAEADALIAPVERELRARLGEYVYGVDQETISDAVVKLLESKGQRLALVESVTLGELAQWLTRSAKGSDTFAGGAVLVGEEAYGQVLGLADVIASQGFPSQAAADAAAQAVRRLYGADLGLAIVGPRDLDAPDAPATHISLALADGTTLQTPPRTGRTGVAGRGWLIHLALDLVRRHLLGLPIR